MSVVLSANHIAKSFGEDVLFSDVTFMIEENEKVAFVGPNGCGKTTLFRILTNKEESDDGTVVLASDAAVGYLEQYQDERDANDIYEYVLHAREDILEMEGRLKDMERRMGEASRVDSLLEDYHSLLHVFETEGGNSYRSEVVGVLKGLGFSEVDFHKSMGMLSGGQKTRVNLAKLLITKPDVLLLDEPINHLDLASIEWLEGFLKGYRKTVIIVAHDRYFLDRIVDKVIDLSARTARTYKGNYTSYVAQKELWQLTARNAYDRQQKEIAHEESVIRKLKQFNREKSIKRAESREKKLEKIEVVEAPERDAGVMRISLKPEKESGKDVLSVEGVSKAFGEKGLFSNLSFHVQKGERVAIIGENGCGKTTLLKIINELIPPDAGSIRIGANVTIGYYDQEQQNLDEEKTLFEELNDAYPDLTETKVRNVLAAFLFRADDVYKKIADLSGGERGRISLCKLMLSGANFLILDEPTNHLDMESKDILENALLSFEGTVLYVSHDRYFVNSTADRILEMSGRGGMTEYLGNYDYYLEKRENMRNAAPGADSGNIEQTQAASKEAWQKRKEESARQKKRQREIEATEEEISDYEAKIAAIDEQFNDGEVAKNSAKLNELTEKRAALQEALDGLYERWETLCES